MREKKLHKTLVLLFERGRGERGDDAKPLPQSQKSMNRKLLRERRKVLVSITIIITINISITITIIYIIAIIIGSIVLSNNYILIGSLFLFVFPSFFLSISFFHFFFSETKPF